MHTNIEIVEAIFQSEMSHNKDEKDKPAALAVASSPHTSGAGFEVLMGGNFNHILEKVFLSLDYETFKNCRSVCKTWADVLDSQTFKEKAQSVFGVSMWMDTEHLERAVYAVDRNIIWWTANSDEVAFVEEEEDKNWVFHFIAEDGRSSTKQFDE